MVDRRIRELMTSLGGSRYECRACGPTARYSRSSDLRIHIEGKHYSPGYTCSFCGKFHKVYSTLRKHERKCEGNMM